MPITTGGLPSVDPRTSEDCLFLDFLLPWRVWAARKKTNRKGSPVLDWNDASGRGHGLVSRSEWYEQEGVILISINYRLGLFVSV